tara:strand:+ start:6556 stop:7032 length:477 start_codon:yes stop_codon:yes gene_type:complete
MNIIEQMKNTFLGRTTFIIVLILATLKHKFVGLIIALLFIILSECVVVEGTGDPDSGLSSELELDFDDNVVELNNESELSSVSPELNSVSDADPDDDSVLDADAQADSVLDADVEAVAEADSLLDADAEAETDHVDGMTAGADRLTVEGFLRSRNTSY